MKTIKLNPIRKAKARTMYREYVKACVDFPEDQHYRRMRDVLKEIKNGHKIICLSDTIAAGGLNEKGEPRFAIAQANWKRCECERFKDGEIRFREKGWTRKNFIMIKGHPFPCQNYQDIQTIIPPIPPRLRPKYLNRYYILWEVEDWQKVPKDPFLLRRIPRTDYYVIVAAWNLTKLERQILKGATK
jgi:hypothetical protein